MGCGASKKVDATTPYIYRPPPSSFAVFDINAIEEPWLKLDNAAQLENQQNKPSHVPTHLLEKLDTLEKEASDGPGTWEEVSKALQDLKKPGPVVNKPGPDPIPESGPPMKKNFSFHTLEDLEAKKDEDGEKKKPQLRKTESNKDFSALESSNEAKNQLSRLRKTESTRNESLVPVLNSGGVSGSLKANPFIMKDRLEKEKEGKEAVFDKIMKSKRDPLSDFPEVCPPNGAHLVVLYTTTLGGVRRTFEDCNRVRAILENHRVVFDERNVSLHGPFLGELKELVSVDNGTGVPVPRLFVKGRYLGGAEEVVELNESGRLGRILSSAQVERGLGWHGCEGCGGARFVPCMECGGSCKLIVGNDKERCPKCNENGLIHCPLCH
ncbi:hypothetical protein SOVF_117160 [Spinacia oleracea]|uniref:Uncharacterized protein At3g28850 n=1 Tax=Spinacia oleracea TaxID=3562 RepID=A0A9R0ICP8_SPIOL|nr:uncharacterized protein At3g28850 [Spinacia oleracea]KNA13419.1 hypothetical protein SOVF_117160 [Spinacia oleracea]